MEDGLGSATQASKIMRNYEYHQGVTHQSLIAYTLIERSLRDSTKGSHNSTIKTIRLSDLSNLLGESQKQTCRY